MCINSATRTTKLCGFHWISFSFFSTYSFSIFFIFCSFYLCVEAFTVPQSHALDVFHSIFLWSFNMHYTFIFKKAKFKKTPFSVSINKSILLLVGSTWLLLLLLLHAHKYSKNLNHLTTSFDSLFFPPSRLSIPPLFQSYI